MPLATVRQKTVSVAEQKRFWKELDQNKRASRNLCPIRPREVFAINATTLGTLRFFDSREQLLEYKARAKRIEETILKANPKRFVLQPVRFFGQRGNYLLEQVHRAPNLEELIAIEKTKHTRYWPVFVKRLQKRGIGLDKKKKTEIANAAFDAARELIRIASTGKGICPFDPAANNFLIHDFDPVTKKFLVSIVDLGSEFKMQKATTE